MSDTPNTWAKVKREIGMLMVWSVCMLVLETLWPHASWLVTLAISCLMVLVVSIAYYALRHRYHAKRQAVHQACLARIAALEAVMNTSGVPGVVMFVGWDVAPELARREAAAERQRERMERLNLWVKAIGGRLDTIESGME